MLLCIWCFENCCVDVVGKVKSVHKAINKALFQVTTLLLKVQQNQMKEQQNRIQSIKLNKPRHLKDIMATMQLVNGHLMQCSLLRGIRVHIVIHFPILSIGDAPIGTGRADLFMCCEVEA
jgi:hypothetical protein